MSINKYRGPGPKKKPGKPITRQLKPKDKKKKTATNPFSTIKTSRARKDFDSLLNKDKAWVAPIIKKKPKPKKMWKPKNKKDIDKYIQLLKKASGGGIQPPKKPKGPATPDQLKKMLKPKSKKNKKWKFLEPQMYLKPIKKKQRKLAGSKLTGLKKKASGGKIMQGYKKGGQV